MIEITTLTDARVSDYGHVGHPDWLREQGLFVAEGRLVVRRLFGTRSWSIRSALVTPAAFAALEDVLDPARCPIYVCHQDMMNGLAGFNFHRGCLALGERQSEMDPRDRFQPANRMLGIEGVGNPDNIGGLFRVAAAFGIDGLLLDRTSGDPLYRKAIRTSMGAVFTVPFARAEEWVEVIATMAAAGANVVAMTPDPSATSLADCLNELLTNRRTILLLGAEGPGLSPQAMAAATVRVRIPIAREVDSLNVVVAAGIALAAIGGLADPRTR